MSLADIRKFLQDRGSFLAGDANNQLQDVDGVTIDVGQLIFDASQISQINPEVLLATIQKESSTITRRTRPTNPALLRQLAGFSLANTMRDQILQAAAQLRRDFNRVSTGGQTLGGWETGVPHGTDDGFTVCPKTERNRRALAIHTLPRPWLGWELRRKLSFR